MKIIKIENIDDKFVAYYLQKFNVPFEHLELKKIRGKETYELIGDIRDQIGKFFPFKPSFLPSGHKLDFPVIILTAWSKLLPAGYFSNQVVKKYRPVIFLTSR